MYPQQQQGMYPQQGYGQQGMYPQQQGMYQQQQMMGGRRQGTLSLSILLLSRFVKR